MEAKPVSAVSDSLESRISRLEKDLGVKVATPDILILQEEGLSAEVMTDLVFENIGGQEIISISRNDIINGQDVIYQPIKNITSLFYQYNPQNILALQKIDKDYFKNFPINLSRYLPSCGTGYSIVNNQNVPNCRYVYIDPVSGDLVIDLVNMPNNLDVEVQIITNGVVVSGTIY